VKPPQLTKLSQLDCHCASLVQSPLTCLRPSGNHRGAGEHRADSRREQRPERHKIWLPRVPQRRSPS